MRREGSGLVVRTWGGYVSVFQEDDGQGQTKD